MTMNDKVYDVLKWFATLLLPAFGTLYAALAGIWGFPYGEQVVGTIMAVVTFLGVILKLSSVAYPGQGIVAIDSSDPEDKQASFALDVPIESMVGKKTITLKVVETDQTNV